MHRLNWNASITYRDGAGHGRIWPCNAGVKRVSKHIDSYRFLTAWQSISSCKRVMQEPFETRTKYYALLEFEALMNWCRTRRWQPWRIRKTVGWLIGWWANMLKPSYGNLGICLGNFRCLRHIKTTCQCWLVMCPALLPTWKRWWPPIILILNLLVWAYCDGSLHLNIFKTWSLK